MSRHNKVNPAHYTIAGRLTPDDLARELRKQRAPRRSQPGATPTPWKAMAPRNASAVTNTSAAPEPKPAAPTPAAARKRAAKRVQAKPVRGSNKATVPAKAASKKTASKKTASKKTASKMPVSKKSAARGAS